MNDAVSFLWRWELAGHPRDVDAWRMMHDFANSAFSRAGVADMHIALAQVHHPASVKFEADRNAAARIRRR